MIVSLPDDPKVALPAVGACAAMPRKTGNFSCCGTRTRCCADKPTGPFRYEPADRFWFAALSGLIPRRHWRDVVPISPGTLLGRHRRFIAAMWDYSARRHTGRPPTAAAIKNLVSAPRQQESAMGPQASPG
ncbi:hypothetical protein [Streptomyces sp. NPDC002573]|uniref:hypothetical protein n=1 Tax=Streptomyces sp. NPDC002573 TaxID=3364651 RepID=UPI0036BFE5FE